MRGTAKAWGARVLISVELLLLISTGIVEARPQEPAARIVLRVAGEVPKPLELTAEALAKLPRTTVRVPGADGKEITYEGVQLVELLSAAGLKFGHDLRGPALTSYLVVEADDGYRAVFALPELDPENTDRVVLLADRRDGKPLDANEGPLRVVVPGEKRHSRWGRQVIVLRIGKT